MTIAERFPHVSFGTSGLRALVSDLQAETVAAYLYAFMQHMRSCHHLTDDAIVVVGMDLRPSSPGIAAVVCGVLQSLGYRAEFLGALPTPALALRCLDLGVAGVMVTGSHIPFDRNGIKFYSPIGEILKEDEQAILSSAVPEAWLSDLPKKFKMPPVIPAAEEAYIERYLHHFGPGPLAGWRIGIYEHSAVGRDLTKTVLTRLGATVIPLGRSDHFVPVDTEAVGDSELALARQWCAEHQLNALVSTDGDGDRPLVFDESGNFVRGDLLCLACARALGVEALAVPVSCNTAIEASGAFKRVLRTRIGSPYVISGMHTLAEDGFHGIAGFEANGGFLLASPVAKLAALPTRDALLPILSLLCAAAGDQQTVSTLIEALPARFTHSDRLVNIPPTASFALLARLTDDPVVRTAFFDGLGENISIDTTDGLRLGFVNGDIIHLRPSGNAPELRCYAEADSEARARALVAKYLSAAQAEIA